MINRIDRMMFYAVLSGGITSGLVLAFVIWFMRSL